jgi:hypothetical protein
MAVWIGTCLSAGGFGAMDGPERLSIPMAVEPRFARMVVAPVVWLPFFPV